MAQKFVQTYGNPNVVTLTTGHAGDYAGSTATAGVTGDTNGSDMVVSVAATTSTSENSLRVYVKPAAGSTTYLFSLPIPARTVVFPSVPWSSPIFTEDHPFRLASGAGLLYELEKTESAINVTEIKLSY